MTPRTLALALGALSIVAVAVVVGIILLAAGRDPVPDSLIAMGSTSVGAIAGIVSTAPRESTRGG